MSRPDLFSRLIRQCYAVWPGFARYVFSDPMSGSSATSSPRPDAPPEPVAALIAESAIYESNPLGVVTGDFVVLSEPPRLRYAIVALPLISDARRVKTTHPGLLVIAGALFLLAAACYASTQGAGAGPPFAVVGAIFLLSYFLTRRGSVAFVAGQEVAETASGSLRHAARLVTAVDKARRAAQPAPDAPLTAAEESMAAA